jgi:hypothetical protein
MTPDQGAATLSTGETTTWEWVDNGNGRRAYRQVTRPQDDTEPRTTPQGCIGLADLKPFDDREHRYITTPDGHQVPAPVVATDSPNTRLRRLIYLKARMKTMEAEIKAHKAEAATLDADIRADWAEEGQNSVTLEGKTAFLFPVYHVENTGDNGPADVRAALEESGLGHMLQPNYSGSALKAYLKELHERGEQPPDALAAVCSLHLASEIRIRDAGTRTVPVVY